MLCFVAAYCCSSLTVGVVVCGLLFGVLVGVVVCCVGFVVGSLWLFVVGVCS